MDANKRELTVEQLSGVVELPTTTIRMYQSKGLLPPPERKGRAAFYDETHIARLELIAKLQGRGFSLAAIKELVDGYEKGESLGEFLDPSLLLPSLKQNSIHLTLEELFDRFLGQPVTQSEIQRSVELGILEISGESVVVKEPEFLEIGPAVMKFGLTASEILDEYEILKSNIDNIVSQFRGIFEQQVWNEFEKQGKPENQLPELAEKVEELTRLAKGVVQTTLQTQLSGLLDGYLNEVKKR